MTATATLYEMPQPYAEVDGTVSLAEVPPTAVAPLARMVADAEPDTTTCPCGARIGHVILITDWDRSELDRAGWETPWLSTAAGTTRALCEDCATGGD